MQKIWAKKKQMRKNCGSKTKALPKILDFRHSHQAENTKFLAV
jgi:hypothetical protein